MGLMKNYKNLFSGSHFVKGEVVSGSQLLLHCSGSVSQMNSTIKVGTIPMGGIFISGSYGKL